jgi:hypothetical protein
VREQLDTASLLAEMLMKRLERGTGDALATCRFLDVCPAHSRGEKSGLVLYSESKLNFSLPRTNSAVTAFFGMRLDAVTFGRGGALYR